RQRHEDARQKFEAGIERARSEGRGRLIGELPWYVVVGEPSSGKSMAIKRSGMEFPFGDQEVQGTGGTLHMDWFFTDEAVLLDTAGNLLYERGDRDDPSRWVDFLKRVKRFRKHAPINGIFLFLPVNSLMEDPESVREEKAKRVATRLRMLQSELRIRCGVYIILSKADKLTGFREFTEALQASSATSARQMLGWSNPSGLDEPLDLGQIRAGLIAIEESLRRRRFDLLYKYHQGQFERRIDLLDALYQLPNQVRELASPLDSYLERIFPKGIWLKSALFLRGIYLTSAEQTGSVIDTALAKAAGLPPDQLPSTPFSDLDRSFFLRDMFQEKAFAERGLVTHAEDAHKSYRKKKMVLAGCGALVAALLLALSAWQVMSITRSIDVPRKMWAEAVVVLSDWEAYLQSAAAAEPGAEPSPPSMRVPQPDGSKREVAGSEIPFAVLR
ncbi:MAG: hypothetical protein K8E66_00210, partial [Phycisphaerales bacterium]|nr:hypothetical protein [Phycisphaerales bacterium]